MGRRARILCIVALAGSAGLVSASCGEREAREACEEFMDRLFACPAITVDPDTCDDVKASERDEYECLAALEDVCDIDSHAEC